MDKKYTVKRCVNCKRQFLERYNICPYCGKTGCLVEEVKEDDYREIQRHSIVDRIVDS